MGTVRTDLAIEAQEVWQETAEKTTRLNGVIARDEALEGYPLHRVEITNAEGGQALGKPEGVYLTLDVTALWRRELQGVRRAARALASMITPLLPPEGLVLVAGLGNAAMTPDALGPRVLDYLIVTRHLKETLPMLRPVAGLAAGVLGSTGLEAAEWIRGVTGELRPAAVVLVDALAACRLDRLCTTVQIADTGLIPGSGVGNHRMALNQASLGMPVVSVGVPTVVEAGTIVRDLLGHGQEEPAALPNSSFFVTPDSIDIKIRDLAKVIGYGLNLAFQPALAWEDMTGLLE